MAALVLQWQKEVAGTEITWPTKPKIFTIWSFTEKVCQPWSKSKIHCLSSTSHCLSLIVPKNYLLDAVIRNLWWPKQENFSARKQKSMSNSSWGECREIKEAKKCLQPYHPKCASSQKLSKGGLPGGAVVKNLPANAGDTGSIPGPGRSHTPRSN